MSSGSAGGNVCVTESQSPIYDWEVDAPLLGAMCLGQVRLAVLCMGPLLAVVLYGRLAVIGMHVPEAGGGARRGGGDLHNVPVHVPVLPLRWGRARGVLGEWLWRTLFVYPARGRSVVAGRNRVVATRTRVQLSC